MRSLSTAFTNMRRAPYQTLAALLLVSITFFVGYVLGLFAYGTNQVLAYFETQPQVIGFFQISATADEVTSVASNLKGRSFVEDVEILTKEQALSIYREENREDPLLLELVTADILPASIEVSGTDISVLPRIREILQEQTSIDEVVLQEDIIESLNRFSATIRQIGVSSLIGLGITSLLVITIVTGIKITQRRDAINIMRRLGATRWYIFSPFVMEGILYGLLGSLIGFGATYTTLLYFTPWINEFIGTVPLLPIPTEVYLQILGIGTGVGVILCGIVSLLTASRMVRR